MVLGSGLGKLAERVCCLEQLFFADLPGLEQPTVPGHQGQVVLGTWARQTVLLFSGRLHFYEGHTWQQVVQPVRIAHDLGGARAAADQCGGGHSRRSGAGQFAGPERSPRMEPNVRFPQQPRKNGSFASKIPWGCVLVQIFRPPTIRT